MLPPPALPLPVVRCSSPTKFFGLTPRDKQELAETAERLKTRELKRKEKQLRTLESELIWEGGICTMVPLQPIRCPSNPKGANWPVPHGPVPDCE